MVEMSTLTYSCIKALGKFHAGVYGNDEDFSKMLLEVENKWGRGMDSASD
jgi:leucyl aminopeptidase